MNKKLRSFLQVMAVIYLGKKVVKLDKEVRKLHEENQKLKADNDLERVWADKESLEQRMRLKEIFGKYSMTDSLIEKGVSTEDLMFIKSLID